MAISIYVSPFSGAEHTMHVNDKLYEKKGQRKELLEEKYEILG
jgi:hypothetical protein